MKDANYKIMLGKGAKVVNLMHSPSGHLVMKADDFRNAKVKPGERAYASMHPRASRTFSRNTNQMPGWMVRSCETRRELQYLRLTLPVQVDPRLTLLHLLRHLLDRGRTRRASTRS